jgi:hypothetical protein
MPGLLLYPKDEPIYSETLVPTYHTTWHQIPEDHNSGYNIPSLIVELLVCRFL